MRKFLILFFLAAPCALIAQKKPLDHSVYDEWQSIGERQLSKSGTVVAYSINVQEGDNMLYVQDRNGNVLLQHPRGANIFITDDELYVVFKIKPTFAEIREAQNKKKKPDEMPKDSLGIFNLKDNTLQKIARVQSYKTPQKSGGWIGFLYEKPLPDTSKKNNVSEDGFTLVVMNTNNQTADTLQQVNEYYFDDYGKTLLIEMAGSKKEKTLAKLIWRNLLGGDTKTIMTGFNDAKNYTFSEDGSHLAFVAERDSSAKAIEKFYKLWYYTPILDSVKLLVDQLHPALPKKHQVSEFANLFFSKLNQRLFFGTAPILPPKDTTLPESERVSVDIWHYNDEELQPQQLRNLNATLRRSYLAYYDLKTNNVVQLGSDAFRNIITTGEGDGAYFYVASDKGKRVARQWQGFALNDVYIIDAATGNAKLIKSNTKGMMQPSPSGNALLMYDEIAKHYSVYHATNSQLIQVAKDVKYPLYDVENDVPDDPNPYGVAKWGENDAFILIYDQFDIWKVDAKAQKPSLLLTNGRSQNIEYRYINTDREANFINLNETLYLRVFNHADKSSGIASLQLQNKDLQTLFLEPMAVNGIIKAKNADILLYSKESYKQSPNLYLHRIQDKAVQLSSTNPQQQNYTWGTAELFKWKAYTGKLTEGIVYKPENFNPKTKYPMIVYFYERNNETLHNYQAPAPTPSRLNISFFVSRGYIVFVPDIWYKKGYPGQSAYDYIVSGTRALIQKGFVDSTKIGIQGQSWGGYQVTYLITRTNLYAAAWAGAPVANMTSAYGGIRWGTGLNRQFQYEKTQSRIGATLWERRDLYLENSPLFYFPKVTTPVVIMHNDQDGAVPWYQGIEMFTALRRLGKKVWMLNYNNEDHNLVQRKNRKDIQIREQQFFDWLLKGEKPAKWISEGVPAIMKGRTLGLEVE